MGKRDGLRRRIVISAVSVLTVFFLILIWNAMSPFLIDNDNIYLKTIASGEMTGKPESHLYYMGILSGTVISTLYRLTGNGIPWFGIFLCASMGVTMALFLGGTLRACTKIWSMAMIWAGWVLVFCTFFYHYFALTQYTISTGMAGAGAVFLLALLPREENLKKYLLSAIPFLLLAGWSMGMRDMGFYMLLPFLGMIFLGKIVGEKSRSMLRNLLVLGCILVLWMGVIYFGNRFAYRSEEWKEFREAQEYRTILIDYVGFPDYESHSALYEELGIQRSSYEAITKHYNILLDPNINGENYKKLAQTARREAFEAQPAMAQRALQVLRTILRRNLMDYVDRPVNVLVYLLYLFVFLLALAEKKYRILLDLCFLGIARMFDWIYLVWNDRYPFRVTQIIYLAELAVLVSLILNYGLWKTEKFRAHPLFCVLCAAVIASGLRFGYPVMEGTYRHIRGLRELSVCFPELEDYLEAHGENFYYFDMSHLYYMEDTLAFQPSAYENYVYMGSWMPGSPWYRHKMERFGITDPAEALLNDDHVFLLYQQVDFDTRDFLDDYMEEHFPGTRMDVVDVFVSSNGFQYEILKPVRQSVTD